MADAETPPAWFTHWVRTVFHPCMEKLERRLDEMETRMTRIEAKQANAEKNQFDLIENI